MRGRTHRSGPSNIFNLFSIHPQTSHFVGCCRHRRWELAHASYPLLPIWKSKFLCNLSIRAFLHFMHLRMQGDQLYQHTRGRASNPSQSNLRQFEDFSYRFRRCAGGTVHDGGLFLRGMPLAFMLLRLHQARDVKPKVSSLEKRHGHTFWKTSRPTT